MKEQNNYKFAFLGTGNLAVGVLEVLVKNGYKPDLIVTTKDKPRGRGMIVQPTPVKEWAIASQIEVSEELSALRGKEWDYFIVAEYGKIIPKDILDISKLGTLNVHPSWLPKFRGPSPIQYFILSGEAKTGVAIMLIDEQVDHGPIFKIIELELNGNENYKEIEKKSAQVGGEGLLEVLPKFLNGEITPQEQDHSQATFTKKINKEDGLLSLTDSPELIFRKIRAFCHWPGAYFILQKGGKDFRLKITSAEFDGNKLHLKKVLPEGKKEMSFSDFLRGNKEFESVLASFLPTY